VGFEGSRRRLTRLPLRLSRKSFLGGRALRQPGFDFLPHESTSRLHRFSSKPGQLGIRRQFAFFIQKRPHFLSRNVSATALARTAVVFGSCCDVRGRAWSAAFLLAAVDCLGQVDVTGP